MRLFNYYPNKNETDAALEKKIFKHSLIIPAFFVFICWMVLLIEETLKLNFAQYGIFPHHVKGLTGIILAPFIHSGVTHLGANSVPFLVLSVALFYFYRKLAYRIFVLIYLFSGIFVWMGGREAWHIGASGIIYGLGAFLFFSGIFRNDVKLLTIAIVVVFLYGGMFWGIFPIEARVSWESHLWGSVSGLFLSIYYRNQGPQRSHFDWEDEQDEEDLVYNEANDSENPDWPDSKKEKETEKT
ncbi:rhomboid family intramembrane serine protease [Gaoshiqia sp. Z1-71]|uniref:rhomboid family intramembrane serine protease n=1 Tax=Gaoshiqia hydrogeniformans TaxID=3290090 RepID=UPI003BF8014D